LKASGLCAAGSRSAIQSALAVTILTTLLIFIAVARSAKQIRPLND
jgi:hypothetical protein